MNIPFQKDNGSYTYNLGAGGIVHTRELAIWCTLLITGQIWRGKLRATPATTLQKYFSYPSLVITLLQPNP
jgi:hypothetical protein